MNKETMNLIRQSTTEELQEWEWICKSTLPMLLSDGQQGLGEECFQELCAVRVELAVRKDCLYKGHYWPPL